MAEHDIAVRETVNARTQKYGEGELRALFENDAKSIVVAKGKKSLSFKIDEDTDWSAIEAVALGRSGNLRAPTARVKKRVLVGYADPVWEAFFG